MSDIEFTYDPNHADEFPLNEGATTGWIVLHHGVGPAKAIQAVAMTDADGSGFIDLAGEWRDIEVTEG